MGTGGEVKVPRQGVRDSVTDDTPNTYAPVATKRTILRMMP